MGEKPDVCKTKAERKSENGILTENLFWKWIEIKFEEDILKKFKINIEDHSNSKAKILKAKKAKIEKFKTDNRADLLSNDKTAKKKLTNLEKEPIVMISNMEYLEIIRHLEV